MANSTMVIQNCLRCRFAGPPQIVKASFEIDCIVSNANAAITVAWQRPEDEHCCSVVSSMSHKECNRNVIQGDEPVTMVKPGSQL